MPPECPGCGCTIRTPDDADRDDDARLCPNGKCYGTDPISRVRASRAGEYSTLDLAPQDVDALLSERDTLARDLADARAEAERLRAENERLAHLAGQTLGIVRERNHYRERAETHRDRIDWMQSVAASAMRQGLAECRRLRAIVEGRTVAPDDATIAAHAARSRGHWLITEPSGVSYVLVATRPSPWRHIVAGSRWIALDSAARPCAWPVVASGEARATEGG